MFTDVLNKRLYLTRDEGKTISGSQLLFSPDKLLFHPWKEDWLLAYSFDERKVSEHERIVYIKASACMSSLWLKNMLI